jgi:hypothetical protein
MALYDDPTINQRRCFVGRIAERQAESVSSTRTLTIGFAANRHDVIVTTGPIAKPDPYAEHEGKLKARLCRDGYGPSTHGSPEQAVAALMTEEDNTVDKWKPSEPTNRQRLVAALAAEMGRPVTPPRFPSEARSDRVFKVNR